MATGSRYFALSLSHQGLGGWAADCAEQALPVFSAADSDGRPSCRD